MPRSSVLRVSMSLPNAQLGANESDARSKTTVDVVLSLDRLVFEWETMVSAK